MGSLSHIGNIVGSATLIVDPARDAIDRDAKQDLSGCLFLPLLLDDDSGKLHDMRCYLFPVLTECRFEDQFSCGDFRERNVGVTEPGNKFHHRSMPQAKLSNAPRDHVHQDMPIWNDFGRGVNEMCFHNLGNARITLTELNSERDGTLIPFLEIAAEKLAHSIVHDSQNTIGEST
jgi:hypothetical protein